MDPIVREQILAIRDSGETNMFAVNRVTEIAMREDFLDLVVYLLENKEAYCRFILTGKEESDTGEISEEE